MLIRLAFFCLAACIGQSLAAQSVTADKELSSLVEVVKMLRSSTETDYDKVLLSLSDDVLWTPMNETGPVMDSECKPSDKVTGFKLNSILTKVDGSRKYVTTHGDMVNGEDQRYDYSLYERKIKAGMTASYPLKGREGKQTFILVPYSKDASLSASIIIDGKTVATSSAAATDGTVTLYWQNDTPSLDKTFTLVVSNTSSAAQAVVIINHNSRKR